MFNMDAILDNVVGRQIIMQPTKKEPRWKPEHVQFLHQNHESMTDEQLAAAVGRSVNAVKIHRVGQGLLSANRSRTDMLTMNQCAKILNRDVHAVSGWVDAGMFAVTHTGDQGYVRLIKRSDLTAWAVNPLNWVYFRWQDVTDAHLRRLCELRAQRWGDEWWSTAQVAAYHGINPKDVVRHIVILKTLDAYQPQVSKGGRHKDRHWKYWYVLKSVAIAHKFPKRGDDLTNFTPRGDAWIIKAKDDLRMSYTAIGRTMSLTCTTISNRYNYLKGTTKCREAKRERYDLDASRPKQPGALDQVIE